MASEREPPQKRAPDGEAPRPFDSQVSAGEFTRRAYGGVLVVLSSNVFNLTVAFVGNLVLARLLTPRDFGVVAVGTTLLFLTTAFAEGGLGGGLVRRPQAPTSAELRTLAGLQFAVTGGAAALIAAVAVQFGETGDVTALMAVGLAIGSLAVPGRIMLIRALDLRSVALMDGAGLVAQYAWSIFAVAVLDLGVWGLASGYVVRAVVATLVLGVIPGGGLYRPTLELAREFGEIVSFGIRFQANWIVIVVRDQSVNALTFIIAGVTTLGYWALGSRLVQVPFLLFDALGRVTFPAMARLLAERRDAGPVVERTARLAGTAAAVLTASFCASTPGLVPALFGQKWFETVWVFPGVSFALLTGGSVAAATVGYLNAANRPDLVLRASLASAICQVGATAALLPFLGLGGIGVGAIAGAAGEIAVLAPAAQRLAHARVVPQLIRPVVCAVPGGALGFYVAYQSQDFLGGIAGGTIAASVTAALLAIVARSYLVDLVRAMHRSLRSVIGQTEVGTQT